MYIFHITTRTQWQAAQQAGRYFPQLPEGDPFVHCSTAEQVLRVAERFYKGQSGLVLLVIDPQRLAAELKWEAPSDEIASTTERFPHIYGPINLEAVVRVLDFEAGANGKFSLPPLA